MKNGVKIENLIKKMLNIYNFIFFRVWDWLCLKSHVKLKISCVNSWHEPCKCGVDKWHVHVMLNHVWLYPSSNTTLTKTQHKQIM